MLSILFAAPPIAFLLLRGLFPLLRAPQESPSPPPSISEPAPQEDEAREEARILLTAAGDNLIHDVLYNQAHARTGGKGYDFLPVYSAVLPLIKQADIAFINQETIMAHSFPPSTYPCFNSPPVLAEQLAKAGFDVVNLSNNHMMDMGRQGLEESMECVDAQDSLTRIGAYRGRDEWDDIAVIGCKGIRLAFLGYTEFTNLSAADATDLVPTLGDPQVIRSQVALARSRADVVVVSIHFGTEGSFIPSQKQKQAAQLLCEAGADIVLGHHPHVIQPMEVLRAADGRQTLVYYSLGNFVSAQIDAENLVGLLARIEISRDAQGAVTIKPDAAVPVVTHYGRGFSGLCLYPLADYNEALAQSHGVHAYGAGFSLPYIERLLASTGFAGDP